MTKKLEEFFEVEELNKLENEMDETSSEKTDLMVPSEENSQVVESNEKLHQLQQQLADMSDLSEHDKDMDKFADEAFQSYREIMEMAGEAEDKDAGKILDSAVSMLKNAIEAKNLKVSAKLRRLQLTIQAERVLNSKNDDDDTDDAQLLRMTRDEVLQAIEESETGRKE